MSDINFVMFEGRLVADAKTVDFGDNKVARFRIVGNRYYKKKGGEQASESTGMDVEVWGKNVEIVEKYAPKGRKVRIRGRLKQDSWEDKEGNKRSKVFILADQSKEGVELIGANPNDTESKNDAQPENCKNTADETAVMNEEGGWDS